MSVNWSTLAPPLGSNTFTHCANCPKGLALTEGKEQEYATCPVLSERKTAGCSNPDDTAR